MVTITILDSKPDTPNGSIKQKVLVDYKLWSDNVLLIVTANWKRVINQSLLLEKKTVDVYDWKHDLWVPNCYCHHSIIQISRTRPDLCTSRAFFLSLGTPDLERNKSCCAEKIVWSGINWILAINLISKWGEVHIRLSINKIQPNDLAKST